MCGCEREAEWARENMCVCLCDEGRERGGRERLRIKAYSSALRFFLEHRITSPASVKKNADRN
jgi:hypothetical protein